MKKLSKQEIEALKKKYGELRLIQIPIPGAKQTADFIARMPNKTEMEALTAQEDTSAYNELMFNTMIVEGDRQYIDDTDDFKAPVYLGVVAELGKLYAPPKAVSKAL